MQLRGMSPFHVWRPLQQKRRTIRGTGHHHRRASAALMPGAVRPPLIRTAAQGHRQRQWHPFWECLAPRLQPPAHRHARARHYTLHDSRCHHAIPPLPAHRTQSLRARQMSQTSRIPPSTWPQSAAQTRRRTIAQASFHERRCHARLPKR